MANLPISSLPLGVAVSDTDILVDVQAAGVGPTQITAAQLKTYMGASLTLTGTPILPQTFTIGAVSYTWPAANGPIGSVLVNSGTGVLSWTTPSSFGTVTSVGLDASPVGLIVGNTPITGSGNLVITGGILNVANGGTGAATPAGALINLLPPTSSTTAGYALFNDGSGNFYWAAGGGGGGGGGGVATFSAGTTGLTPVGASTGNVILGGTLGIANGGTGVTSLPALQALVLPAQAGNPGKVLGTNGTTASWVAVTGTGTVTSVSLDPSTTGLTVNGGTAPATITASGTFILGGTLAPANGGTGRTSLGTGVQTALGNGVNTNGGFLLAGAGNVLPIAQGGTGQATAAAAITALLPAQSGGTNGQVLTSNGTNAVWQSLSGVSVSSISGGTTGMSFGAGTGAVTMTGTLAPANGGTGVNGAAAPNGSLLIGNGTGYTLATLTPGTGIAIDNSVPGAITINATGGGGGGGGVSSVATTLSGLTVANPTTTPSIGGTLGFASGGTGLTATPTNGQIPIGNGAGYTLAQITSGTNINVVNAAGAITINSTITTYVSSVSGGSTGLTPLGPTTGAIVLGGLLNVASGGTGLSAVGVNGSALVSNGTTLAYGNPLYATNLLGAVVNSVPYQSAANTTSFAGPGAAGSYLAGNGAGAAPSFKAAQLTLGATVLNLNATTTAITGMSGITMTGGYIPPGDDDVATKGWVSNNFSSVNRIAPANVATTTNLGALSGLSPIDGYTPLAGERILVKNQTSSQDNGVYIAAAGVWSRATDLDQPAEFTSASVFVLNGTTQANTSWIQTATVASVGTSPQVWQQQSGIFNYSAGAGISIAGTTINNTGVLSLSTGTTGLTVSSATGNVTIAGTLAIANGGTSATTAQGARTNLLPTQAGQNGKFLQSNGTDVVWAAAAGGAVYYIQVTSGGTIPAKISGAGFTDAAGNSYVLYNNTAANITLTATTVNNYASFTDCTATSIVLGAGKTMMISTAVAGSTYFIDASNYLSGGILVATPNASSTMSALISGIPGAVDNEGNLYAIENTSNAPIVISSLTVDNPSSFPGFTTSNTFTIPAYGEALVLTTLTSTNYVVLNISNSVATNLFGGGANRIAYQTAANATDFLPTGTAGQVLKSNGSGSAPTWGTANAAFYIDATTSTAEPISTVISTAGFTDAVGSLYVIYNSSSAAKLISAANIDNAQSFPTFASSSTIALQPKQTATIVTDVVGTNYSIVNVSNLAGAAVANVTASDTVSNLLTGLGITEYNGLLVTLTNTTASTQTITAATFNGHEAFAPATSTGSIKLPATESVTLIVTTSGTTYQIVTMSSPSLTTISTAANYTTSTAITNGFVSGNLLSITNTATTSITVTAASLVNSGSYPANATSTVFTVGAGATVTLALASASADNWQIVSYSASATTALTTASANGTITAAITAGSIAQQIGMLVTIRNTGASTINLTGTLTNFEPFAPAADAARVYIQPNECVTVRVVTPGSAYAITNLTTQNVALNLNSSPYNLNQQSQTGGMVAGDILTITNTQTLGNLRLDAVAIDNYQSYPVQATATRFIVPKDGTVTLQLMNGNDQWKIVSFEYPGLQAGAVAFAIGNATGSPATLGPSKVIDATTLFPVVTYGTPDTASLINPQNYLDTATGIFQPLVAGYYQINASITQSNTNTTPSMGIAIVKNWNDASPDILAFSIDYVAAGPGGVAQSSSESTVVYMNGTTDTLRVGLYISSGAWAPFTTANSVNFSGSLVTQQNIINTTSGIYNVPLTSADNNLTVPAILAANGITEVVNDLYVITNTETSTNVTITATSFIGWQAYPSQATSTNIVLTPGATLELQNVTIGSGYQIVILNTPINVGSVAFSAAPSASMAVPLSGVVYPANVMKFQTTVLNPQNYYDINTGRYTPKTAGYYQFNLWAANNGGFDYLWIQLYKNGVAYSQIPVTNDSTWGSGATLTEVVYMNGTTDYVEFGAYYGSTGGGTVIPPTLLPGRAGFSGFLTNQTLTTVVGTTAAGYAYKASTQAIASSTFTKVTFVPNTDPQSWWNSANNRWIPTIPGYYQVDLNLWYDYPANPSAYEITISQNGAYINNSILKTSANDNVSLSASRVIYMNGTTDYLEAYVYQPSGSSVNLSGSGSRCNFSIALIGANQAVPAVKDTTSAITIGPAATPANGTDYCIVQIDNIKAWFRQTGGQAGLTLSTVSGSMSVIGDYTAIQFGGGSGWQSIPFNSANPFTLTTTANVWVTLGTAGRFEAIIREVGGAGRVYRINYTINFAYINSSVIIERIVG